MSDKLTNIALSGDDFDAFSKALDNPSEPNEALKSLFAGRIADLLERCGERIGGGEPNTFTDEIYDAVDRLRAFSAALDRNASQVREGPQQSSDMVERVARLRRFIETRKRIASPSAADEQSLIADLEAITAEASHHAEAAEALREIALADRAPDFEPTDEERAKYWSAMAIYQREVARVALAKITSALIVTETVGGSFGSRPLQVVGHSTAGPLYEAPRDGEGVFIASDGTLRVAKIGGES